MKTFDWSLYKGNLKWLQQRTILLHVAGSHAYGTNTPESDMDFAGVVIPPSEYFFGYVNVFHEANQGTPVDLAIRDIRKFFKLAADANPNVLETLFIDPSDYCVVTKLGQKIIENRNLFLSTKARHTYAGYAHSQLHRIKGHKEWLMNPREHKPTRAEYGLPEETVIGADILGAIESTLKTGKEEIFSAQVMEIYRKERQYQNALREYQQYQNWKATRNPKRAGIEAKFGFDTKHASHLVRLIRSGKELLKTGTLTVKRPDAEELLSIRNGSWTYEQLLEYADTLDSEMEELEKISPLPHSPDHKKLDNLCQEVVEEALLNGVH